MSRQGTLFIVPSLRRAGAENQIVQLVNGLPSEYFDKHLLSYLPDDELLATVQTDSVTHHHVLRQRKIDLSVIRRIGRIIDENKIDIVHCTLEHALLYGALGVASADREPALICALHTTKQTNLKHKLADVIVYRHYLKKCEQVWFMCHAQADIWARRMPFLVDRHKIIYNGIKTEAFNPFDHANAGADFRDGLGIAANAKVICCVAGLRAEKRHDVLLDSFKRVCDDRQDDCYLLFAGSGPMENSLRQKVRRMDLETRVFFLGELADVRPLLAAADCKVLPSAAETFSMAMLEAMAMQVPVVSTNVGGASEAIDEQISGLLISPGDAQELADALSWLLTDDSRRTKMGVAARRSVTENFTYAKMVEKSRGCLIEVGENN